MTTMGQHPRLTTGQRGLATAIAVLTLAASPVFFLVMFTTVNHLVAPSFGWLAWTVPIATELSFVIMYLLELEMEWLDRAPGWLRLTPYPFAAASLLLNVYASRADVPGMVGHGVVTVAFFIPMLALKAAVHRLTVSDDDRKRETATADAIAHARDILSSADRLWRFRAPRMLRRQLRSRRLPAAVMEAIDQGVMFGGASKWEPIVEAWITRSLALPEGVSAQLAAAREAASRSVIQSAPGDASASAVPGDSAAPSEGASGSTPRGASQGASGSASRKRRLVPAKASNDELAELILPLLDGPAEVKPYGVIKAIKEAAGGKSGIGYERAEIVLELARRKRVVPIKERQRA